MSIFLEPITRRFLSLFQSPQRIKTMNILHLDSSIMGAYSASRDISAAIVDRLGELNPGAQVTYRDLAAEPPLHLSGAHMSVFQGAPVEDAVLGTDVGKSSAYIQELFAADIIVIGAPMYNFTISTQLKSWIDRVIVASKTFQYGANGPESLLPPGKKVFLASTRGGAYGEGSPAAFLEHHESYLHGALGFIGLTDVTVVRAEGLAMGDDAKAAAIAQARGQIAALA
jgi:FMN-dependent NADH-azoreductase